jgi:hypothetical protein
MRRWKLFTGASVIGLVAVAAAIWAFGGNSLRADDTPYPVPKPGPEHEILKSEAGVWDASVEMMMNGKTEVSKGVETNTMMPGGLWLLSDFKGKFGGMDFVGHGVSGYDTNKKKYVGTWVDSMSTGLAVMEETYDPAKKTMTGTMEGPDETGKVVKLKLVTEWKDDNTRIFSMSGPGPDGKDVMMMRITYTRRSR